MPDYNIYDERGRKIGKIKKDRSTGLVALFTLAIAVLVYGMYAGYVRQPHAQNWLELEAIFGALVLIFLILIMIARWLLS